MNEYILRRDCLKSYAESKNVKLIIEDEYGLDKFVCNVNKEKLPDLTKRCETYCYPLRFRKLCEFAKENGYDTVSTTLLYSIYQKHDYIAKLLEELSAEYGLTFLYRDFREGWREGQDEARAAGLYMQKYCGCVYSEEESTFARTNKKLFKNRDLKPTNENARKLIEDLS
jgi:predicted adenine nucleotide alpha hydrolase (AANH) superfamily ATPase